MFDREGTQVRWSASRATRLSPSPSTAEERLAPGAAILVIGALALGSWALVIVTGMVLVSAL
jgi:hypothetical protein